MIINSNEIYAKIKYAGNVVNLSHFGLFLAQIQREKSLAGDMTYFIVRTLAGKRENLSDRLLLTLACQAWETPNA